MLDQPDLFEARTARNLALEQVSENSGTFSEQVLCVIARLPRGSRHTGETIRLHCQTLGINPHHHNAWGAVINSAKRRGLLTDTGRMVSMTTKKSHARKTPELMR